MVNEAGQEHLRLILKIKDSFFNLFKRSLSTLIPQIFQEGELKIYLQMSLYPQLPLQGPKLPHLRQGEKKIKVEVLLRLTALGHQVRE